MLEEEEGEDDILSMKDDLGLKPSLHLDRQEEPSQTRIVILDAEVGDDDDDDDDDGDDDDGDDKASTKALLLK